MECTVRAYANGLNVFVVWKLEKAIPGCAGFQLQRKVAGASDDTAVTLSSAAPFEDEHDVAPHVMKPSDQRPFQRCSWNDWTAPRQGDLQYRVRPVMSDHVVRAAAASDWSKPVSLGQPVGEAKLAAYFNDGVIAAQWVADEIKQVHVAGFVALVKKPGTWVRQRLGGQILPRLLDLLAKARSDGGHVYAALYELNDVELIQALCDLGPRAHVVLSNGSPSKDDTTGEIDIDPNSEARATLKEHRVEVHDRIFQTANGGKTSHLGHNKFLVVCGKDREPLVAWTGSTNWTWTGLCTQMNNALLIRDPAVARDFLEQWKLLAGAGAEFPPGPKLTTLPTPHKVDGVQVRVSFTPYVGTKGAIAQGKPADLAACQALIDGAKHGVLFFMFIPGPKGTLLETIEARYHEADAGNLYVRGVVNQDPGPGATVPSIALAHRGEHIPVPFDIVYPGAVGADFSFWLGEMKKLPRTNAMIHSKVVVLDPFGEKPVVITGSHNLGTKASLENDENLVIVEGDAALAQAYAVNVVTVFNQYWWRFNRFDLGGASAGDSFHAARTRRSSPNSWEGLKWNDAWQKKYLPGGDLAFESKFWG
jgi:hypothetical protein